MEEDLDLDCIMKNQSLEEAILNFVLWFSSISFSFRFAHYSRESILNKDCLNVPFV